MIISDASLGKTKESRNAAYVSIKSASAFTQDFVNGARIGKPASELESYLNSTGNIGQPPWEAFLQAGKAVLDGYQSTGQTISVYLFQNGSVNGSPVNVLGSISSPDNESWWSRNKANFFYISQSDIASDRTIYYNPNITSPPGSGVAGPVPLPFLIGPTWDPYRRTEGSITIPPLDYLEAKRQPGWGDYREHGNVNRVATIRIIDTEGTCWYATSNYIITGVQKREQTKFIKIQTSEGDYTSMNGSSPRVFRFTGELLSMNEFEYAKDWLWNWDRYLKGTVTSENNARFYMLYGGWIVEGHLVNYQMVEAAMSPFKNQFVFDAYITTYMPLPKMTESTSDKQIATEFYEGPSNIIPAIRKEGTFYLNSGLSLSESIAKEAAVEEEV